MTTDDDEERRQFGEYFLARRDAVRRTAYLLCGDWYWADDLTQVAFTRLAAAWRRVRDRGSLNGFVHTCLVRAYLADLRRVWRRRERSVAVLPDSAVAHDGAEDATRRLVFAAAMRRLPPRQRAVLVCRYYEGLDVGATAETLGCSTGTVKSQTARGLDRLRKVLGEAGIDELIEVDDGPAPRPLIRSTCGTEAKP